VDLVFLLLLLLFSNLNIQFLLFHIILILIVLF